MKKLIRKVIFTFMILIIVISIYHFKNILSDSFIKEIQIISHNKINSLTSKSDIDYIIDSFETNKIENNIITNNLIQFKCNLVNMKDQVLTKEIFIDYDNVDVYFKNENDKNIYKIEENFDMFYFTHGAFNSVYENSISPSLKIITDGRIINHSTNTKWSYKKLDGNYYSYNNFLGNNDSYKFDTTKNINFNFSKNPTNVEYILYKDMVIIDAGTLEEYTFKTPDIDGHYMLSIKASYNDKSNEYKGTIECDTSFIVDLPPTFSIDKQSIYQGDILKVNVKNLNSDEIPYINQNIFNLFSFSENIDSISYGYIPISYKIKEGNYKIAYGINNNKFDDITIHVLPGDFNVQHLTIDSSTDKNTRNDEAYEEFNKYYTKRRYESNSKPYFKDKFMLPVKGRITTEYGQIRYVNNSSSSSNHSGLDIAAPQGTSIIASNSGKVVLSMYLTLTGNTILIDHGNGFFSTYYHMEDRLVEEGDMVAIGQEIGTVGSTGFSTGPHLHFTMSYYDQNLQPGYFIYNEPITYNNYKRLFELE